MKIYFDILAPSVLHIIYVFQIWSNLNYHIILKLVYNSFYYDKTKGFYLYFPFHNLYLFC